MGKKILITAGCVVVALLIGVGGYGYYLYHSVKSTANEVYEPSGGKGDNSQDPEVKKKEGKLEPISILLMGVDQRAHDVGRSDTLIMMTLNPKDNKMQMVSIPRDSRVDIPGRGEHKINAAYAYGGTNLAMNTVKNFLDVPIDYYIRINMEGMADLVDAVGGIKVYNNISWHDEGYYKKGFDYHKGWLHLDGKQALGYVRMRHKDPRGDFGRNERQRDVIQAVIKKAANFSSFSRYNNILQAISDNVKTDIPFDEMKYIAMNYRDCRNNVKNYEVKGNGTKINGVYFLLINEAERQKVHDMIAGQLKPGGTSVDAGTDHASAKGEKKETADNGM